MTPPDKTLEELRTECPFCGDKSSGLTHINSHLVVWCSNCGAYGPSGQNMGVSARTDAIAIERWNTRSGANCRETEVLKLANIALQEAFDSHKEQLTALQSATASQQREVERLRECLEPGKAGAITCAMFREAERLGIYEPTAKHALTQIVEHIESLREQLRTERERAGIAECALESIYAQRHSRYESTVMVMASKAHDALTSLRLSTPPSGQSNSTEEKR